ncbi:MAG: LysM peptidoglycan-binding domain-containing protein, partial [Treponemataceae bacterium]|nr:LysM peptidoglycan-binding domain-containing protein [Treponemataceae bacterium]
MGGFETSGIPVSAELALDVIDGTDSDDFEQEPSALSYSVYRVKSGDMIGIIAENAGVTQDTLISVNNIRSTRLLQIGTYLKVPSIPGVLYT